MNVRLSIVTLLLTLSFLNACQPATMDYATLVRNLSKSGATVEEAGEAELPGAGEPIFSVTSKVIEVNGERVNVLEYPDEATAETEAKYISSDGFNLTTSKVAAHVDWIAPPHWYRAGRIILLYVGQNQEIIDLLENSLGKQFAGAQ